MNLSKGRMNTLPIYRKLQIYRQISLTKKSRQWIINAVDSNGTRNYASTSNFLFSSKKIFFKSFNKYFHPSVSSKLHGNHMRHFSSNIDLNKLLMPALSPTMQTGNLAKWRKKEGEELVPGDVICEVETDKAVVDYEMQDDAVLAKILVPEGTKDIAIGTLLAYTVEDEEAYTAFLNGGSTIPNAENVSLIKEVYLMEKSSSVETLLSTESSRRTPLIKFIGQRARERKALKESTKTAPPPKQIAPLSFDDTDDYVDIPLSNMRKVIAKRLTESKVSVPHYYASIDVEIDSILNLRKRLRSEHDINVSMNDFLLRSVAYALRDVPAMNHYWNPTTQSPQLNPSIDISVAVATKNGLITPIVTRVNQKSLMKLNSDFKDLVSRARENKLKPEEYQGGSFTISNLGGVGIDRFTAVINPPQSCIMAVGRGRQELVPSIDHSEPELKTLMTVTISADRRIVDDTIASTFLQTFQKYMNYPELFML